MRPARDLLSMPVAAALASVAALAQEGERKIVPMTWGGKFPFQTRVELVTQAKVELPKGTLS